MSGAAGSQTAGASPLVCASVAPLKASSASAHRALSGCSTRASCAHDARRASAPAEDARSSSDAQSTHLLVARFHFCGRGAQRQPQHRVRPCARGALRQHIASDVRCVRRHRAAQVVRRRMLCTRLTQARGAAMQRRAGVHA